MNLSPVLQAKVKTIAHRYGKGWDGDDLAQDCFVLLWELPEGTLTGYALRSCHNLCIHALRKEGVRASESLEFEPVLYGEAVDLEKYIRHIKDLRLQAIVDQFVDKEALSGPDLDYLYYHRKELDRDIRKYLKQKSAWQILVEKIEPFRRSLRKLKDQSVRLAIIRAQ